MGFAINRKIIIKELKKQAIRFPNRSMKRPFVTLSFAQSLDGCLSAGPNQQTIISHRESSILTHQIRSLHHGILVGINTIKIDNPKLNVRHIKGPSPRVIIIDPNMETPLDSKIFRFINKKPPIIICDNKTDIDKISAFRQQCSAEVLVCNLSQENNLEDPLNKLYDLGIKTLMVEGGGKTIFRFIQEKFVDYFVMTISPMFLGSEQSIRYSNFSNSINDFISKANYQKIGTDIVVFGSSSRYCESDEWSTAVDSK